jgi:hypothetical protein
MRNFTIPKVQEVALSWTATEVRKDLVAAMGRVFDRPTPYTPNSLFIDPVITRKGPRSARLLQGIRA